MRYLYLTALFFIVACQFSEKGKAPVAFEKMPRIVWELMQSDGYYSKISFQDSTLKGKRKNVEMYQQIFELNKVTAKDFYSSIDFYEKHPLLFKELMDSVAAISKREKTETIKQLKQ
jgi:hypothetical protein